MAPSKGAVMGGAAAAAEGHRGKDTEAEADGAE